MSVLVVGVSHKSAPVALLERLALDADGVTKLVDDLMGSEHVGEATVIATCNRLEVYADVDRFHGSVEEVSRLLVERAGESTEALVPHLYVHYDDGAVSHLFNVASGLDSMVVGEGQILGQTREALRLGQELGSVGPALNVLFQQALRVGKRSHAETDIDRAAPSLVTAALERIPGSVAGRRVVVVGAGAMASLAISTVFRLGASDISVVNRSSDNADRLARDYAARSLPLVDLTGALAEADVVVSCTGAAGVLITRDALAAAREGVETPLAIIDLALPARRRARGRRRSPASASSVSPPWPRTCATPTRPARSRACAPSSPRRSAPSSPPATRPASPRPWSRSARWPPRWSTRRWSGSPPGCPTSTSRPAPRCCTPSAASPTSSCTSRPCA